MTTFNQPYAWLTKILPIIRQSLFVNAGYLFAIEVVNSAIGLIFWFMAARLYSADDIGTASALIAAATTIVMIGELGIGNSLVRFLPASNNPACLLSSLTKLNLMIIMLITIFFLLGIKFISPSLIFLHNEPLNSFAFTVFVVATSFGQVTRMTYLATKQAKYMFFQAVITNLLKLLVLVLFTQIGFLGLFGANLTGVIGGVVASYMIFLPNVKLDLRHPINLAETTSVIPYSLGNYFAGLFAQLPQRLLPILVLEIMGPSTGGYSQISWLIGSLLVTPGIALAGSAFAESANAPHKAVSNILKSAGLGLGITVCLSSGVYITAPWVLDIIGRDYANWGTGLLRWLAVAAPLVVFVWHYFTYLRVQKKMAFLLLLSSSIAISVISFSYLYLGQLGIPAYGMGWTIGHGFVVVICCMDIIKRAVLLRPKADQLYE